MTTTTLRKANLRVSAEKGIDHYNDQTISIFKAMQYRWDDGETADPIRDDISYHLSSEEAIEAAKAIRCDLGFSLVVEKLSISYDEINEAFDFGEEFELSALDDYKRFQIDYEEIWSGKSNAGAALDPDGIIVNYRHHRYMNYAYDITGVDMVCRTKYNDESDLVNLEDSTFATYAVYFKDINELAEAFESANTVPFNKLNSGNRVVREFLEESGHPEYVTVEVDE